MMRRLAAAALDRIVWWTSLFVDLEGFLCKERDR